MRKNALLKLLFGMACFLIIAAPVGAKEGFPLRKKYPTVKYMTEQQLNQQYDNVIIIDVRSKIEFDVIHINKAHHIPIARATFGKEVGKIRKKNASTRIAFYCNGHTCAKSYKATKKAMDLGFKNVYVFDAGIYDWVNANPDKTSLLGTSPAPKEKLISNKAFKKRKVNFASFKKKAGASNTMVIDIREPYQRKEIPKVPNLRNIPQDRIVKLLADGKFKNKQLLFLDAVGKQVRWLQYYLVEYGYKNYYFLSKGVLSAKKAGAV